MQHIESDKNTKLVEENINLKKANTNLMQQNDVLNTNLMACQNSIKNLT
jgi:FtsZ-binding cell division protein ZapB